MVRNGMYIPALLRSDSVLRRKTRARRVARVVSQEQELRHEKHVISEGIISESED